MGVVIRLLLACRTVLVALALRESSQAVVKEVLAAVKRVLGGVGEAKAVAGPPARTASRGAAPERAEDGRGDLGR